MNRVTSGDGTTIAFDRLGHGRPVIVVGGQVADRTPTRPTAEVLAKHFTVFNYDRWVRGDAVEYVMRGIGMPSEMLEGVSQDPRVAMVPTMAYDSEIMGDTSRRLAERLPNGRH